MEISATKAESLGRWGEILESALDTLRYRSRNEALTVSERMNTQAMRHRVLDRLEDVERQKMEELAT